MKRAVSQTAGSPMLPSVKPRAYAADKLLAAFLAGRAPATMEAYSRDLADFAAFVGAASIDEAAAALLGNGQGEANRIVLDYRAHLESRGLAPATVRRRLASLRALCKVGRLLCVIQWRLDVPAPRVSRCRDTRGCGLDGLRALLAAAREQVNPVKVARDVAMLRLMGDVALRRGEVTGPDMGDLDLDGERVAVRGKGQGGQKQWITIAPQTVKAIREWVNARARLDLPKDGPLFVNLDHRDGKGRLKPGGLYAVLGKLGEAAGIARWHPHGLRHAAVTAVLDITGGDLRTAQKFARHADPKTTLAYDDALRDVAGEATRMLAAMV